ncbi:hypothetical protein EON63_05125 [archaeon]|nr:MAG: hypothetical protein EON63_05125 [archaeon]
MTKLQQSLLAECTKKTVPNKSILSFEPKYYKVKFCFRTMKATCSWRLSAKNVAKSAGKVGGVATRVSGLVVEVVAHAVQQESLENFMQVLHKPEGRIVLEDAVEHTFDYGVLHGRFAIQPYGEGVRGDNGES